MSLLKRKRDLRPGFSQASFKASMLDWTMDRWGLEPNSDWVRKHLTVAHEAYEKMSEAMPYGPHGMEMSTCPALIIISLSAASTVSH